MLVYMRPKYTKYRHQFPNESKTWAFRRTLFGENAIPPNADQREPSFLPRPQIVEHEDAITFEEPILPIMERVAIPSDEGRNTAVEKTDTSIKCATLPVQEKFYLNSSLTISEEEVLDENCRNDPRWNDPQKLASWEPIQRAKRNHSSVLGSSLEVISELSEMSFVDESSNDERWNAGPKSVPIPCPLPDRKTSQTDTTTTTNDENLDQMQVVAKLPLPNAALDSPMSPPQRRLSPPP